MADERIVNEGAPGGVETTDRGLFDFMKKKEEQGKPFEQDHISSGVENVHVSEQPGYKIDEEKKHESLLQKLHHSDSNSSSSDEEGNDEEKKRRKRERKEKKKAGIKEKFEEKLGVDHKKEHEHHDTNVPIEKIHMHPEEKKQEGFMDKIKDKLPGQHADDEPKVAAPVVGHHEPSYTEEEKEKKGFLDKIKDKIPGLQSKNDVEEKKDYHHEEKKEGY